MVFRKFQSHVWVSRMVECFPFSRLLFNASYLTFSIISSMFFFFYWEKATSVTSYIECRFHTLRQYSIFWLIACLLPFILFLSLFGFDYSRSIQNSKTSISINIYKYYHTKLPYISFSFRFVLRFFSPLFILQIIYFFFFATSFQHATVYVKRFKTFNTNVAMIQFPSHFHYISVKRRTYSIEKEKEKKKEENEYKFSVIYKKN